MGTASVFPDQKTCPVSTAPDPSSRFRTNRAADLKFTQNFKGPRTAKAMSLLPLEPRLLGPSVCLSGRLAALPQAQSCSDGTPGPHGTALGPGLACLPPSGRQRHEHVYGQRQFATWSSSRSGANDTSRIETETTNGTGQKPSTGWQLREKAGHQRGWPEATWGGRGGGLCTQRRTQRPVCYSQTLTGNWSRASSLRMTPK